MTNYDRLYALLKASIKEKNEKDGIIYLDSTIKSIESLYFKELNAKTKYFNEKTLFEKNKIEAKRLLEKRNLQFIIIILLLILVILYISTIYCFYKKSAKIKLDAEREKNLAEIRVRNTQFAIMRKYIIDKIKIEETIIGIKKSPEKVVKLSNKDWEEIEVFLETTDNSFVSRIKDRFPKLSSEDYHLLMLLRLNMPSKSLSMLYGISDSSIKHNLSTFKKKIGLVDSTISLRKFVCEF